MKLPTFNAEEIAALQLGMASLGDKLDTQHIALVNKLALYARANKENQGVHIVLNATIKDLAISNDHSGASIPDKNKCIYSINIESSPEGDSYYFSVYNQSLDIVASEASLSGLFGVIEIRDGKPCISLGITPDDHDMQILSNNSTQLMLIPSTTYGEREWETVTVNGLSSHALVFTVDDTQFLGEQRNALADIAFADHDFGDLTISEDGNWERNDTIWKKPVYIDNDSRETIKGEFTISFADDSSHIISATHKH